MPVAGAWPNALAHAARDPSVRVLRRDPDRPKGVVTMPFGRDDAFRRPRRIVSDGGTEKLRFSAESGRPAMLRPADAKARGRDPVTDT